MIFTLSAVQQSILCQRSPKHRSASMDYRGAKHYILARLKAELSDALHYHGLHHTHDVLRVAKTLCQSEGVQGRAVMLVKTAALYHDCGFVKNKHAGHEYEGCLIARASLPGFGYTNEDIEIICGMIMATKIPQSPKNKLEEIIADADLEYLGTEQAGTLADALFHELRHLNPSLTEAEWNKTQVSFLENHHYFTSYCKKNKEPLKSAYLGSLVKKR